MGLIKENKNYELLHKTLRLFEEWLKEVDRKNGIKTDEKVKNNG